MKYIFTIFLSAFVLFCTLAPVQAVSIEKTSPLLVASMLPSQWDKLFKNDATLNQFPAPKASGNGFNMIQVLVFDNLMVIFRYMLISIVLLYIVIDIMTMIFEDANGLDSFRKKIGYYAVGLLLMGFSSEAVKIFDTVYLSGGGTDLSHIGNVVQAKHTIQYIINFIALIAGAVASFFIVVSVVYMVSAQGDEGVIKEQRKTFGHAFFGLVVIIMADAIINKTFYPATDTTITTPGPQQIKNFAAEIFGMAGYFLQFLAVVCVFFLVLAGFYYIISFADDAQAGKAKLILQNLGIGFLSIVFAYTVVSAITPMLSGQVIAQ